MEPSASLRFLTCGSVDDGKSTLLGRLIYESGSVLEDQLEAVKAESGRYGTQGDTPDLALLLDGLQAEREQGITIDVAYRYFSTQNRSFIAADAPGHEQYTRNMVTAASNCDLAVLLVNASLGLLRQTKRHARIVSLLGIRHVILAVNKMDEVGYSEEKFLEITNEFKSFSEGFEDLNLQAVPVCALAGDNVCTPSAAMDWYQGAPLLKLLEEADVSAVDNEAAMRLPVQFVNRPNSAYRGFCGTLAGGTVRPGEEVTILPSGKNSTIKQIDGPDGELKQAHEGQAITLLLEDEIDINRGDVICAKEHPAEVSDQIAAHLIWMDETAMLPERPYLIRFHNAECNAQIMDLTHRIDVNHGREIATKRLELNEIGYCKISLDREIAFDPYSQNRRTGSFILIDRYTHATVGAGLVEFGLRRASNIQWQETKIGKAQRARMNAQQPRILWFTGLSGSGKSTIADRLEQQLQKMGHRTYLLDGDNVRHGLNRDLGFTDQDRVENIRRVAEVAKLMVDAGLIVLVSFISPFRSERQLARDLVEPGEFFEVYVNTPLEICEVRDPKGLYKKARAGELKNFTGIDSDYEPPESPEILLSGGEESVDTLVAQVLRELDISRD